MEIIQSWVAVQMTQCLTISFLWRQISTFSLTDKRQRKIRKIFKISVTSVTRPQMSLRVAMNELWVPRHTKRRKLQTTHTLPIWDRGLCIMHFITDHPVLLET